VQPLKQICHEEKDESYGNEGGHAAKAIFQILRHPTNRTLTTPNSHLKMAASGIILNKILRVI
jgi:hypothetical protein